MGKFGVINSSNCPNLTFSGNDELLNNWSTNLEHRIDGRFKNNPNNIMYNQDNTIWVDGVVNNVKIGKLAVTEI